MFLFALLHFGVDFCTLTMTISSWGFHYHGSKHSNLTIHHDEVNGSIAGPNRHFTNLKSIK